MSFIDDVNRDYETILRETDPGAQMRTLIEGMKANKMEMEGKPFPTFLKPYFVNQAHRDRIAYSTRMMLRCIEKVGKAFMEGYDFQGLVHQDGLIADLSKVDPVYPRFQVMVRLDVFYDPHTADIKYLEFNCGDPSGMGWHDAMLDIFLGLPAVKKMGEKYAVKDDHLLETHHDAMIKVYREWCEGKGVTPKDKPTFAIVCWKGSTILSDVEIIVDFYRNKGYPTVYADPADFSYDGKQVKVGDQVIDAVYRDAITDFLDDKFLPNCQDILQAYREENICFVNPVRAATGDFKTLPGILIDPRFKELFTAEELEAAHAFIPWTRMFAEEKADFKGKEVDLVPFVRERKDDFVIKKNEGYGGFGVIIGRDATASEWDKAIETALAPGNEYAVQEFVDIPQDAFPVMEGETLKGFEQKNVNINFWSHGGEFAGAFLRASTGNIINVHQGGGLVPVLFVDKK